MAAVKTFKVNALPGSPVADAIYYVKTTEENKWRVWVTSTSGVARALNAITSEELATALLVKANDASVVHLAGIESITGVKNFTVSPTAPTPTTSTQVAIKSYVDTADGSLQTQIDNINSSMSSGLKSPIDIDCSGNPNYPASVKGDTYIVTVAGKIGGAAGPDVEIGDMIVCKATSATGTHAAVGANFFIVQNNINQATESIFGIVRKNTSAEALAGSNDVGVMTALKVQQKLDSSVIKYDVVQALSAPQKIQALSNIGAMAVGAISGTAGKLAKYGSSNTLVDSIVTESGNDVSIAGQIVGNTPAGSGGPSGTYLKTAAINRWGIGKYGLNTGSDAGDDLVFWRFSDTGSLLGNSLTIQRSTGNAVFNGLVSGITPIADAHFTTKQYVDGLVGAGSNWFSTEW